VGVEEAMVRPWFEEWKAPYFMERRAKGEYIYE
jgi:hypothetical protein